MRRSIAFISALGFSGLLGLSGCTALQDLDQFEEDFSCGVDIRVRDFFPHAQEPDPSNPADVSQLSQRRERFGVYVVQERREASGAYVRKYIARAFFDPLPAPNVDIRLPFAIEASQNGDEKPATLELHADRQILERNEDHDFFDLDPPPTDHSWVFPHACSEEGAVFDHTADFDELQPAEEQALGLKVRPPRGPTPTATVMAAQFWVDNTIEIRVVREAIIDGQEVDQARAFYRRGASTDLAVTDGGEPDAEAARAAIEEAEIDLGGVLRDDESVEVIIFLDRNSNGLFDSGEIAVSEDINFETSGVPACDRFPNAAVCVEEGDNIVVTASIAGDRNTPSLITEAWWTHVVP